MSESFALRGAVTYSVLQSYVCLVGMFGRSQNFSLILSIESVLLVYLVLKVFDSVPVIIMCMTSVLIGGEDQKELLLAALDMGMVSDGYVFIPYDALLYAMPYQVHEHFSSKHIH